MLAKNCEICGVEFDKENVKCMDHNHWTGELRYVACSSCNILIRVDPAPLLLGHDINNSECHFLLKSFSKRYAKSVKVLMKDSENIISIKFNGMRFLDTKLLLNHDLFDLVDRHKKVVQEELQYKFPYLYQELRKTGVDPIYNSRFLFKMAMPSGAINREVPDGFPHSDYFLDPITNRPPEDREF